MRSSLPSEQSKSPVSAAHSVPLLQLYFDLNIFWLTWKVQCVQIVMRSADVFEQVHHKRIVNNASLNS